MMESNFTYEQAAAIIPLNDVKSFLSRNGWRMSQANPKPQEISVYLRQIAKSNPKAAEDLKSLTVASAKNKLGSGCGCGCGGNCGGKKMLNADGTTTVVQVDNPALAWAKKHQTMLTVFGLIVVGAWLIKKM